MSISGNYNADSQKPKFAVAGGKVDRRYVYASDRGWTLRHYTNDAGTTFYDEVIVAKTLYTDSGLGTRVTQPINAAAGAGNCYPNGVYAAVLLTAGSGYTAATNATTPGIAGTGLTLLPSLSFTPAVSTAGTGGYTSGVKTLTRVSGGTSGSGMTVAIQILLSTKINTAGTGYTAGAKACTGGSGTGRTYNIAVDGNGAITAAVVANKGYGYLDGDVLTPAGGDGTARLGLHIPPTVTVAGTGYSNGVAATSGGTGTGRTYTIAVSGGAIQTATIAAYGSGYVEGDILTVAGGDGAGRLKLNGVLDSVTRVAAGNDLYVTGDVQAVAGGTGGQVTLTSYCTGVSIVAQGKDYVDGDTVSLDTVGTGATARIRV